jgi:hypothetical protein
MPSICDKHRSQGIMANTQWQWLKINRVCNGSRHTLSPSQPYVTYARSRLTLSGMSLALVLVNSLPQPHATPMHPTPRAPPHFRPLVAPPPLAPPPQTHPTHPHVGSAVFVGPLPPLPLWHASLVTPPPPAAPLPPPSCPPPPFPPSPACRQRCTCQPAPASPSPQAASLLSQ